MKQLLTSLIIGFYKVYFTVALSTDGHLSFLERVENFIKSIFVSTIGAFILFHLNAWFSTNRGFMIGVVLFILINMILGAVVHKKKGGFDWKTLLKKTIQMCVVLLLSYFVLEVILSIVGESTIVQGFRITIQVSTLLYPGSKILKNIFIISEGEHPPKWVMEKIYNFQENGDLKALFEDKQNS